MLKQAALHSLAYFPFRAACFNKPLMSLVRPHETPIQPIPTLRPIAPRVRRHGSRSVDRSASLNSQKVEIPRQCKVSFVWRPREGGVPSGKSPGQDEGKNSSALCGAGKYGERELNARGIASLFHSALTARYRSSVSRLRAKQRAGSLVSKCGLTLPSSGLAKAGRATLSRLFSVPRGLL